MKQKLFTDTLDPNMIHDSLEAESVDIEDNYKYVKPFTAKEEDDERKKLSKAMVNKSRLEGKISDVLEPLKEELKAIKSEVNLSVKNMDQGGITTHGRVYGFAEYQDGLMGLYDENGDLVDTRPLNRAERQLHINSNLKQASDE